MIESLDFVRHLRLIGIFCLAIVLSWGCTKEAPTQAYKRVPDVLICTVKGDTVRLSALYKQSPVLLSVYLGVGCPMCVMSMKQLSQHAYRFKSYGWNVVGLSNDAPEDNREALEKPNLDSSFIQPGGAFAIELFSDNDHAAMEALDCYRRTLNTERHGMFLIDTAGNIRFERIDRRPFQDWNMLTDSMKAISMRNSSDNQTSAQKQ